MRCKNEINSIPESYKPPFPFTRKEDWYHGIISRQETERRLREGSSNYKEGSFFLIRRSTSKPGFYALSVLYAQRVFHFEVCKRGQYYYIDYGPYLESLEHVVSYYMNHADGLPVELQRPIKPPHPVKDDNVVLKTVNSISYFCTSISNQNSPERFRRKLSSLRLCLAETLLAAPRPLKSMKMCASCPAKNRITTSVH